MLISEPYFLNVIANIKTRIHIRTVGLTFSVYNFQFVKVVITFWVVLSHFRVFSVGVGCVLGNFKVFSVKSVIHSVTYDATRAFTRPSKRFKPVLSVCDKEGREFPSWRASVSGEAIPWPVLCPFSIPLLPLSLKSLHRDFLVSQARSFHIAWSAVNWTLHINKLFLRNSQMLIYHSR